MEKDIFTENILSDSNSPERERIRAERQEKLRRKREKEEAASAAAKERGRRLRRMMVAVFIGCLVIIMLFGSLIVQIVGLQKAKAEAQANLDALQQQIDELETTLNYVTTPEYIEEQARSQLRMIYPNEVLYIVEEAPSDDTAE